MYRIYIYIYLHIHTCTTNQLVTVVVIVGMVVVMVETLEPKKIKENREKKNSVEKRTKTILRKN